MIPSLNLLPPADKKQLRQTHLLLTVYEFAFLCFITVAIGSAAMFFAQSALQDKLQELTLAEIPGSSKLATLNRNVRTINQTVERLARITKNVEYWSPRIADIVGHTPSGIRFNSLSLEADTVATIQGVAQTRNDLKIFRDTLGTSPFITRIDLPLQYFVEQAQVEFTLEIVFQPGTAIIK